MGLHCHQPCHLDARISSAPCHQRDASGSPISNFLPQIGLLKVVVFINSLKPLGKLRMLFM